MADKLTREVSRQLQSNPALTAMVAEQQQAQRKHASENYAADGQPRFLVKQTHKPKVLRKRKPLPGQRELF